MKHFAILIFAVVTLIAIRIFKNHKKQILIAFLLCLTLFSLLISLTRINGVVSFIRPINQLFYQTEYLDEGVYADSILPIMVKDKTVYTKDDIMVPSYDMSGPPDWEYDIDEINYGVNSENLLKAYGADTIRDKNLNDVVITDDYSDDFEDLGWANDMLRFSWAVSDYEEEYGNAFHHYYFYSADGSPMHIYLHVDENGSLLNGADEELVAIWQIIEDGHGEDLYIMDKGYFDSNFNK